MNGRGEAYAALEPAFIAFEVADVEELGGDVNGGCWMWEVGGRTQSLVPLDVQLALFVVQLTNAIITYRWGFVDQINLSHGKAEGKLRIAKVKKNECWIRSGTKSGRGDPWPYIYHPG